MLGVESEWLLIAVHAGDKDNLYTKEQTENHPLPLNPSQIRPRKRLLQQLWQETKDRASAI
jgi:hypothetical protein